jgi:flagellar biosynthetic protein FlhB
MAEQSASDRTEKATPERLRKAREEGQVPQSAEVPSAVVILVFLTALSLMGGTLYHFFAGQFQQGLQFAYKGPMRTSTIPHMLYLRGLDCLMIMAPLLVAACVASVLGSVVTSGWNISTKSIAWKPEALSPTQGFKTLFSLKSLVQLPMSLLKIVLIGLIVYVFMRDRMDTIIALQWTNPAGILAGMGSLAVGIATRLAVAMAVIAAADLFYRRWQHNRDLRMTRQEVKEERKRYEMPAEIKGRMRGVMIGLIKKRMLQKVKTADVIVTNPTHVAVALKYDALSMAAPQVVAKGADLLAERIRKLARENNVPIVEKPELARALYHTVELDQFVPETLFVAVAEILAMIHRLSMQRKARGAVNG